MLDIKFIIKNQDFYKENLKKRESYDINLLKKIEESYLIKNDLLKKIEELNSKRNIIAKELSSKIEKNLLEIKKEEARNIKLEIQELEVCFKEVELNLLDLVSRLPNILDEKVPYKKDTLENVEILKFGKIREFDFEPKDHLTIGEDLKMLDSQRAVKISGSRFMISRSLISKLERALMNLFLDHCEEYNFIEHSVPYLISSESAFRAGQLPKFEEEIFKTTDNRYLISTSEMAIANIYSNEFISYEELPLRICSYSPCFRREAGSAGKDTKGLIRLHQFNKVELFSIVKASESEKEHERMIACSEDLLKKLELPFRKILLCSQDTGFAASKTYDLEVWFPSQKQYREIASCSNTKDFQARRANIKVKIGEEKEFAHMLNGSCLALGRALACIIENFQNADGSINIPNALVRYMNGAKIIKN